MAAAAASVRLENEEEIKSSFKSKNQISRNRSSSNSNTLNLAAASLEDTSDALKDEKEQNFLIFKKNDEFLMKVINLLNTNWAN